MGWTVILDGNRAALEYLAKKAELFSELGGTISVGKAPERGERYYLTSPTLDVLHDAKAVASQASKLLDQWNGAARLVTGIVGPVSVQQVSHRDHHGRQSAAMSFTFRVLPPESSESEQALHKLLQLSADPEVSRVLGLCGKGNIDWVNAYRVFEVIEEACGGIDGVAAKGWASKAAMRRFKHTANHPEATGDSARHGMLGGIPPANPMSAEEASALMSTIIDSFLGAKGLPSMAGYCALCISLDGAG
jgi:hypothetical protein